MDDLRERIAKAAFDGTRKWSFITDYDGMERERWRAAADAVLAAITATHELHPKGSGG